MSYLQLLVLLVLLSFKPASAGRPQTDTVYLAVGTSIDITANSYGNNVLRTFCYPGKPRSLFSLFETVELVLSIANDDYSEYGGRTPEEVLEHYTEKRSLFSFTLFSQKRQNIQLSPFEQQCIGVSSKQPYNISLKHAQLDIWRLLQMSLGIAVFWSAGRLAKNSLFYYMAGMVLGICASLLVIIAVTSKLFPRRPMMYGVLIGGWTIGLYILKQLSDNIRVILITYREYVLWYLVITGLISFLVCYRIGPPKNPRSQNIIMWVLQAVGSAIVYFSSWHTSACVVLLVLVCSAHYCPNSVLQYVRSFYKRRFPPKRRLLTQEEYYEQAVSETARSLAELREYVNSPSCRQWSVISALRDPMRFASFANGAPHLFDEEIEDYSRTIEDSLEGADEEEAFDFLQSSMYYRPTGRLRNAQRTSSSPASYPRRAPSRGRQLGNNNVNARNDDEDDDDDDEFMD
ncbi:PREDICTED: nuclear envelope integral membrane protein 1 [Drosophila arizonae]|uniref:Nuclear envelope integral membrane protein 1 n=1 Tax=Drosophila arizonae TaxID=7263 RepID=A0ABM1PQ91_DROAR|nr:PREDICTED: nuclear envelope integral membrane protein 1 [Drosophila arizonae]